MRNRVRSIRGLALCIAVAIGCNSDQDVQPPSSEPAPVTDKLSSLAQAWDSGGDIPWEAVEILVRLSQSSYSDSDEATAAFRELGFEKTTPNVAGSMVSYIVTQGAVTVVVFRGTDDVEDWITNLKVTTADVAGGSMHGGFHDAYQTLRSNIHSALSDIDVKYLWITGHSLGGALAAVCAHDLIQSDLSIHGVITFGQPMMAKNDLAEDLNQRFANNYERFINGADIVPRVPPLFAHAGSSLWFHKSGVVHSAATAHEAVVGKDGDGKPPLGPPPLSEEEFKQLQDKLRGARAERPDPQASAPKGLFPFLDDHGIDRYVEQIEQRDEAKPSVGLARPNIPIEPGKGTPRLPGKSPPLPFP